MNDRVKVILLIVLVVVLIGFYMGVVEYLNHACEVVGYTKQGVEIVDCPGP